MPKRDEKGIRRAKQMRKWADKKSPKRPTDDGLDRSTPDTLASLCDEWLRWLEERNRSESYLRTSRQTLAQFLHWSQDRDLIRPDQITKRILESYQRHLWHVKGRGNKPLSVGTQKQRLMSVQNFFKWLCRQDHLPANPASDLELPKEPPRKLPLGFHAEELAAVMAVPDVTDPLGVRDRAILETLYGGAIRRSELARLDLSDIDHREQLATLHGKGDKQRIVPVGERAMHWLTRYLAETRPLLEVNTTEQALFLTGFGTRFSPGALGNMVKKLIQQAEVTGSGACHRFRHACATDMLNAGADSRVIQQMLGHASASTTAIYTAVDVRLLRAVHAKTHPGGELDRDQENG